MSWECCDELGSLIPVECPVGGLNWEPILNAMP